MVRIRSIKCVINAPSKTHKNVFRTFIVISPSHHIIRDAHSRTLSIKIQNGKTNKQDDSKLSQAHGAVIGGGSDYKNKVSSFSANRVSAMIRMRVRAPSPRNPSLSTAAKLFRKLFGCH